MGTVMRTVPPARRRTRGPSPPDSPFAPIAADLEEAERIFDRTLAAVPQPVRPAHRTPPHYRGKRLRPALLLLTAKACGEGDRRPTTRSAAVVEMIHTATLVHDDVLDEADTAPARPDRERRVGQQGQHPARRHAVHARLPPDEHRGRPGVRAHRRGDQPRLRGRTAAGAASAATCDLTEADYFAIIDGKTAALTECCGRLGALYAGASEEVADAAGELRPEPRAGVPDRRRPARPGRRRGRRPARRSAPTSSSRS